METNGKKTESYTLGSGHWRVKEIEDKDIPTTDEAWIQFVTDLIKNHPVLGRIKGGASIDYTTEKTEDQDDLGYVILDMIKSEKVEFKTGVMTWDGDTLEKLCATARVTTDDETNIVTVKVGGLGNQNSKRYVSCFEHYSHLLRVVIIGKNTNGFSITFEQDKATVIDAVFRAEALDNDGTLVIIQDFRKATDEAKADLLKSIAPSTPEQTPPENDGTENGTGGGTNEPSDDEEI